MKNIARIAKAALHKLPGKSSSIVRFACPFSSGCPVCPACPDDHDDHDDHLDLDDHHVCKEVGGCTQASWRLSDHMREHCRVDRSELIMVSHSVTDQCR